MSFTYLPAEHIERLSRTVIRCKIGWKDLIVSLPPEFVSTLRRTDREAADTLALLHELNRIERLRDDSVPLLLCLGTLANKLELNGSPDIHAVRDDWREVYAKAPDASRKHHGALLDLFQQEAVNSSPPLDRVASINLFTLATAGAGGGGATALLVAFFPTQLGGGAPGLHGVMLAVAAIPAGALGAVHLWSAAEELERTRERVDGQLIRYLLISLGVLVGGGAINLLAHVLAEIAFTFGPWPEGLALGVAGASGALCAAWSRALARPTTVFVAAWTGAAATGGTLAGYMIYVASVRLLTALGHASDHLIEPTQHAVMVGAGAFVFVTITQSIMALQLHGVGALRLSSTGLAAKPERALVPKSVLPTTALGATAVTLAVMAHSCVSVLQATNR